MSVNVRKLGQPGFKQSACDRWNQQNQFEKKSHNRSLLSTFLFFIPIWTMTNSNLFWGIIQLLHCVKSVRIRSYSGPYSVRMRENADQNNSEYWYFSRSAALREVLRIILRLRIWKLDRLLIRRIVSLYLTKLS